MTIDSINSASAPATEMRVRRTMLVPYQDSSMAMSSSASVAKPRSSQVEPMTRISSPARNISAWYACGSSIEESSVRVSASITVSRLAAST